MLWDGGAQPVLGDGKVDPSTFGGGGMCGEGSGGNAGGYGGVRASTFRRLEVQDPGGGQGVAFAGVAVMRALRKLDFYAQAPNPEP